MKCIETRNKNLKLNCVFNFIIIIINLKLIGVEANKLCKPSSGLIYQWGCSQLYNCT